MYTLIKPDDYYIIVSQQTIKPKELFVHNLTTKVHINNDITDINHDYYKKVLFSQNPEHNLPTITFSDEVAKELGIVDVENLSKIALRNNLNRRNNGGYPAEYENLKTLYKDGYNQALSDNKDKLFTLEQAKDIFEAGFERGQKESSDITIYVPDFDEYIQSLTKQEWEVELESEPYYTDECERGEGTRDGENIQKQEITLIENNSVKVIKLLK